MDKNVELALLIRQGQLKLSQIPEADRQMVRALTHGMTDAQAGTILAARERKTKQFGRSTVHPGRALS